MKRLLLVLWAGTCFLSPVWAEDEECFSCHGQKIEGIPAINSRRFSQSVHAPISCLACHADASSTPHPPELAPVSCANCHSTEVEHYVQSDHGRALSKGGPGAALCAACHGDIHGTLAARNEDSSVHRKNVARACAACHADAKKMAFTRVRQKESIDAYEKSVHGAAFRSGKTDAANCVDCHGSHNLNGADNPKSRIFHLNVPQTCGKCHGDVRQAFDGSVHGQAAKRGIVEAPVCTDCHGEHTIRAVKSPESSAFVGAITRTCAKCHASEKIAAQFGLAANRVKTYQDSFHGLASQGGDLKVANCASCHGWHDILPSKDPRSAIHSKNLPLTCGKCHTGIGGKEISGKIHAGSPEDEFFLVQWAKIFYICLISLAVGFMLLHNLADFFRKLIAPVPLQPSPAELGVVRLSKNERLQHGLLIILFLLLAYSGFALKYPQAWWAEPFHRWGGETSRRWLHRNAALAFSILAAYHFLYMLAARRGRFILRRRLALRFAELSDSMQLIAYNLGFGAARPNLNYPSYIEKFEYWALVWGSLIMMASGALLVFNNWTLLHFPLWMTKLATVVHYYEAILACLAILLWHFYWTIFDPSVYPMNKAWITGRINGRK